MAQRLSEVQQPVVAYNRIPSKLEPLREFGAEIAESPDEAIQASECVILMLTNATAIHEVLLPDSSKRQIFRW